MSMNNIWAISSWISFLTSADISVLQRATTRTNDLDSTANSREQSQKAQLVRSPRNSEFDAAREYFRSWTFSPFDSASLCSGQAVERWAFSSEIARSDGATSRVSGQSYSLREWIYNSAWSRRLHS